MSRVIHLLNDLSYAVGIIGLAEIQERKEVAAWVFSRNPERPDPRGPAGQPREETPPPEPNDVCRPIGPSWSALDGSTAEQTDEDSHVVHLVVLNCWYFTLGDVDCVPSVPHGHEHSKTQKWPKLNPYTGKVFTATHQEDRTRRLARVEMQLLWRNESFVDHCRQQVQWYSSHFPRYPFANARRGIYEFPRW